MSWKFGGVYINKDFGNDPVSVLNFLQIDKRFTYEKTRFTNVVNASFKATAIGFKKGFALVHDNSLPYNNSFEQDKYNPLDYRMRDLSSENIEILSFYIDDITESYGLAHFKNNLRYRHLSFLSGELIHQEGEFHSLKKHPGDKMFEYLQEFTGFSFNSLVLDHELEMFVFTETGF
jgi:hypothetical protein